ncbi:hypothetical protein AB4Y42_11500 [Paraburkholderia sp. EG286B]|uniref:hypothetical protein n=1 Tax=Paraburkholderia sp. EG286B TaxID=3237011 RepID=UPI0034D1C198
MRASAGQYADTHELFRAHRVHGWLVTGEEIPWSVDQAWVHKANDHINAATWRLVDQACRVQSLERAGLDAMEGSRLLENMWDALITMYLHRCAIKQRLRPEDTRNPAAFDTYVVARELLMERLALRVLKRALRVAR